MCDKLLLIQSVEARPAIWDKGLPDYNCQEIRKECWIEICRIMIEGYDDSSKLEKEEYCRYLVKLWKHIKDRWAKTLKMNKIAIKSGLRPRLYKYHKEMLFMTKSKSKRFEIDNDESEAEEQEEITAKDCKSDAAADSDNESDVDSKKDIKRSTSSSTTRNKGLQNKTTDDPLNTPNPSIPDDVMIAKMEAFLSAHSEIMNNQNNRSNIQEENHNVNNQSKPVEPHVNNESIVQEDRHVAFFKSMHPSLTSLNDDQTLEFQSGVLNILRNIKNSGRFGNFNSDQPYSNISYYVQPAAPVVVQQPVVAPEATQSNSVGSSRIQTKHARVVLNPLIID